MWWRRVIIVGLLALGLCDAQTCGTVYSQMVHCLDDGDLQITCPNQHWILITETTYYVSESATCPTSDTNDCVAPGEVEEVRDSCHQQQECFVSIPERTNSACSGSTHYLWVQYQCEPLHNQGGDARAVSMCNDGEPFTGTLVHVDSHPSALFGSYITELNDCNCAVTIQAGNDILFRLPFIVKQGSFNSPCDQKVVVWNADESYEFCQKNSFQNLTCSNEDKTYYIRYDTADTSVRVIFLLQVFVPYGTDGLTLTCGIHPDDIPNFNASTTVEPVTDAEESTTTQENDVTGTEGTSVSPGNPSAVTGDSETDWKLPIIIGMVALSVLIMIIVILILCVRYRNDQEKDVPDDTSDRPSNFHFITEVYIEGDQKSKLVVDKKNGLMRM